MAVQRYSVNQHPVSTLLTWINSHEIAIPEIQRPFVWNAAKARDFIDSLYQGYPVEYLIAWRNPNVRLKDGGQSNRPTHPYRRPATYYRTPSGIVRQTSHYNQLPANRDTHSFSSPRRTVRIS